MSDDECTWEFLSTAEDDLDGLSPAEQDRILGKLDEIVSSPWREPPDYGEPLQNSPYKKIRVGEFRLSVSFRQNDRRLVVARVERRGGAYTADDDYFIFNHCFEVLTRVARSSLSLDRSPLLPFVPSHHFHWYYRTRRQQRQQFQLDSRPY